MHHGKWFEANIAPAGDPEELLIKVVDPLVHGKTPQSAWFFFWEDAEEEGREGREDLRLRVKDGDAGKIRAFLDAAPEVLSWYEGAHGVKGKVYAGEADFYGDAVWEDTCRDWTAMSELSLRLVKLDHDDLLVKPRSFHLRRGYHLYCNQLKLDDIMTCLRQAHGYLELREKADGNPHAARLLSAIDDYLYGDKGDSR